MARNQKDTVEYFPHIAKPGKTIYILENKFGNNGYAFWFKLLELLCQTEGHFLDCSNEMVWQFLVAKTKVNEIPGSEILDLLANLGNIDSELWKQNKVIWCESLILNIKDVYTKRGRDAPLKPNYCHQESTSDVISEPAIKHGLITVPETPPNDDSRRKSTQSKVKESKVKESKIYIPLKDWPEFVEIKINKLLTDESWIKQQETDHPYLNVKRTVEKSIKFWKTKAGWNKKNKGNSNSDWEETMSIQCGPSGMHRVFKPKESGTYNSVEEFVRGK